jgi:hypothetical protein
MGYWRNVPHVTFLIVLAGVTNAITGTMVYNDDLGITILNDADGKHYSYGISTIQNASKAGV